MCLIVKLFHGHDKDKELFNTIKVYLALFCCSVQYLPFSKSNGPNTNVKLKDPRMHLTFNILCDLSHFDQQSLFDSIITVTNIFQNIFL